MNSGDEEIADVICAREFQLVDREGNLRGWFKTDPTSGLPTLLMVGNTPLEQIVIQIEKIGCTIGFDYRDGEPCARVRNFTDGRVGFALRRENGSLCLEAGTELNGEAYVTLFNKEGECIAKLPAED